MIELADISVALGNDAARVVAPRRVSLSVDRGEFVSIVPGRADRLCRPVAPRPVTPRCLRLSGNVHAARRGRIGKVRHVVAYGSIVLNATGAMFVDVDSGGENADPRQMSVPRELSDLVARRPDLGFRVYRTLAGWRYLCTTALA